MWVYEQMRASHLEMKWWRSEDRSRWKLSNHIYRVIASHRRRRMYKYDEEIHLPQTASSNLMTFPDAPSLKTSSLTLATRRGLRSSRYGPGLILAQNKSYRSHSIAIRYFTRLILWSDAIEPLCMAGPAGTVRLKTPRASRIGWPFKPWRLIHENYYDWKREGWWNFDGAQCVMTQMRTGADPTAIKCAWSRPKFRTLIR